MNKKNIDDIEKNIDNAEKKLTFIEKFKTSKKFRAKLELISYGVLILIIILYANFSSLKTGSYNYVKNDTAIEKETNDIYRLDDINDDYKASINVIVQSGEENSERNYEIESVESNVLIKKTGDNTEYKLSDLGEFYTNDNVLVSEKDIFDLISYKYLELSNVKKYIKKGTVDYTTKYSTGVELISYKVKIKDILLDNNTEDYITIDVTSEKDKVSLDINYTNLLKTNDNDNYNVKIIYIDNNEVEED